MPTLQETLLAPETRPHVIADCEDLVDREVADMSGVTGTAVRLAYKTVRTFDAGHIPAMIESILPSVAGALQPYWAHFTAEFPGGGDFGGYLASREDEVAEALLAITDSRRRASSRATRGRRGAARDHRQPPPGLQPRHDREGLQHRPRQRRQARENRPARPRRARAEVHGGLTRGGAGRAVRRPGGIPRAA